MKTLLSLLLLPSALCAGISLQSLSPARLATDDLLSVRFNVDAPGTGGVWIDEAQACVAELEQNQAPSNRYICRLTIPYRGTVQMQIRFDSGTGEQRLDASVYASSLAIVSTIPVQPKLGRKARFNVWLGRLGNDPQTAPTGKIVIHRADGVEMCTIALRAQSSCQAAMNIAGRNEYTASYSGDSNHSAIVSAPFAILTQQPGLTTEYYADDRDSFYKGGSVVQSADGGTIAVSEFSLAAPVSIKVIKNGIELPFPRLNRSSGAISLNADGSRLLLRTVSALVPEDSNTFSDVYSWDVPNNRFELLSRTPSGTRPANGVKGFSGVDETEGFVFYSVLASDIGLVGSDQVIRLDLRTQNALVMPAPEANCIFNGTENRWILWRCFDQNNGLSYHRADGRTGQSTRLILAPNIRPLSFLPSGSRFLGVARNDSESNVGIYDIASGSVRQLGIGTSVKLSSDERFAIIPRLEWASEGEFWNSYIASFTSIDLNQSIQASSSTLRADSFAISSDGCWITSIGGRADSGLQTRANPLCKELSYVGVVRITPSSLTYADKARVDVLVNHKSAGAAPSGVVRITGVGGQCDAVLTPQGSTAFGRCEMKIGRVGAYDFQFQQTLKAEYLGDQTYSASESIEAFNISQRALNVQFDVDPNARTAPGIVKVNARILNPYLNQPFRGSIRFRSFGNEVCNLSAQDIALTRVCEFYADGSIVTANISDPNYTGRFAVVFQKEQVFSNGFEIP